MSDMAVVALVIAGIALVIAVSWQLAGRKAFDAIEFAARLVVSFIGAAATAALLLFAVAVFGIAGRGSEMDMFLKASFWMSIGVGFVIAISPGGNRKPFLIRFIARWIWAWVRVVGAGILLLLGFCAAVSLV